MYRALVATSLLACGFLAAAPAAAETTPPRCIEITSLPVAPITTAGVYCLTKDLATAATSGTTIPIQANNVTIDCNDHKVGGTAAGPGTTAVGIGGSGANATVRNCNVRGFRMGILLLGEGGAVEDNRLDGNTWIGVYLIGDGGVVRGNRVFDTGGNTGEVPPVGIQTNGDIDVLGNTVANVMATAASGDPAYGIRTDYNDSGAIGDNHVRNILPDGANSATGIYNVNNGRISIYRNRVSNPGTAGYGLLCAFNGGPAIASDNHINGFSLTPDAMPFCFDGGNNVAR